MSGAALKDTAGRSVGRPFKAGQSGNPAGKPKGAVSKFNRDIKEMILTALEDVGGAQYLAQQAHANPVAFMGLVGKVLPLQLAGSDGGALVVDFRWRDPDPVSVTIDAVTPDTVSHETNDTDERPAITFISDC